MGDRTGIEWTDATWNPMVGCSRVSPGCDFCYAETQAPRQKNNPAYEGVTEAGRWTGRVNFVEDRLAVPLRWRRPRRIFVNSVSDVFHDDLADEDIAKVWAVMGMAGRHVFQILTKRPRRMEALLNDPGFSDAVDAAALSLAETLAVPAGERDLPGWPFSNVWMGVSVESAPYLFRVDHLRRTNVAVRWVSGEPLIGPIVDEGDLERLLSGIDWIVVGGESDVRARARPMHPAWARAILDGAAKRGVPRLFKQWGIWEPIRPVYPPGDVELPDDPLDDYDGCDLVALEETGNIAMRIPGHVLNNASGHQPDPRRDPWWLARVPKHDAGRVIDGVTIDEYPA